MDYEAATSECHVIRNIQLLAQIPSVELDQLCRSWSVVRHAYIRRRPHSDDGHARIAVGSEFNFPDVGIAKAILTEDLKLRTVAYLTGSPEPVRLETVASLLDLQN